MPFDLYEAFKGTLFHLPMWRPGESVLVAASGGPDSICVLHLFCRLREESPFPLAAAHLNHGLRGAESDRDAEFVASLASGLDLPFHLRTLPAGSLAGTVDGLEGAARRARYAFLTETARQIGASRVAVGHTRDDQAETFLMRLLRGSGARGLAGIYPMVDGVLIRPLLDVPRSQVETYLQARGIPCRTDSSNADLSRTRNRVRARLLPLVRDEFNPEIDKTLARTAEIFREEEAYLRSVVRDLEKRLVRREGHDLYLSLPALRVLPAALRRRLLRSAIQEVSGSGPGVVMDFEQVEELERLVKSGKHGAALTLGTSLESRILYGDLTLLPQGGGDELEGETPLPVPGEARFPGLGLRLRAERVAATQIGDPRAEGSSDRALLDADSLPGPLFVRGRRPGDAFCPLGSAGESKLKAYLIDRKVPRPVRNRIPLVVAGSRIAWVVGFQIDDRFKVTDETRRVLVLSKEVQ